MKFLPKIQRMQWKPNLGSVNYMFVKHSAGCFFLTYLFLTQTYTLCWLQCNHSHTLYRPWEFTSCIYLLSIKQAFTEHLHDRPDSYLRGAYILIHGIYWTMFWAFVVLNVLLASPPLSLQAHCKEVTIYRCSLYHYYCYYYCTGSKTKTSRDEQLSSISRKAVVCPAQNSTIVFLESSVGIYTALANELQGFSWCVWKKLLK